MNSVFAHGQLRLYLLALLEERPQHGYEVIRALKERFGGLYAPSAGSVYPRLSHLEDEGLVARTNGGRTNGGRTVIYSITDAGRAEVHERTHDIVKLQRGLDDSVHRLAAQVRDRVHAEAKDLRAELKQAAREAQRTAAEFVGAPDGGDEPVSVRGAEEALQDFVADVRRDLRRREVDDALLTRVRAVLDDTQQVIATLVDSDEDRDQ